MIRDDSTAPTRADDTPPLATRLTRGQAIILTAATLPMIGTGLAGAYGTYTNITSEFGRAATAIGVVAAGEGATLVLALVMVGLTLLGQSAPAPVRSGLWLVPIAAAGVGLSIADNPTEAVIYAITPMAMCVSAEGMGLLARRIVIHRTGIDAEAQRRNAATVQRLAYHRAAAAAHPDERQRRRSELAAWRLAKRVGVGDAALGVDLVQVQRERLRDGADAALAAMFMAPALQPAEAPALTAEVTTPAALPPVTPEPAEMTTPEPAQPVIPTVLEFIPVPARMTTDPTTDMTAKVTTLAADQPVRRVVTELVTPPASEMTDAEIRKAARKLNREAMRETSRPVTIATLRTELGLSRRDATELRREIVEGAKS